MAQCTRCGQGLTFALTANIKRIPLHRLEPGEYEQLSWDKLAWQVYRVTTYGGKMVAVHVEPHVPQPGERLWLNHMTVCRVGMPAKEVGTWDKVC
jgi:hypothetical protein